MEAARVLDASIVSSVNILNPFAQKLQFTTYDKIKIAILSVTLFPIRLVVILLFFLIAWLFTRIVLIKKDFRYKPISGWRRHLWKPLVLKSLRVAFAAAGFYRVPIRGKLASQKEAPILILGPHSSFFELVPIVILGGPAVLAKNEIEKVPVYGDLITLSQPVYVQQDDKVSRRQTVREIRHRAFSDEGWGQIVIFPEGTCTNRSALITFKQGGFYPAVPVQPVCLSFPNKLDTCTWTWQGAGVLKTLWLSLCQFSIKCEIEILPVYNPSKAEIHDPKLFSRNVQKVMADHLKVPISDWSFNDIRFIRRASKINIPVSIPVVKLMKLRNRLQIEDDDLRNSIRNFENRLKSCSSTFSDHFAFAQLLEIENNDVFQEFFDSIDQDRGGTVDVRSYLCCMWLLRTDISVWERIEEAFKVLSDGDVELESKEFCLLLWLLLTVPFPKGAQVFQALDRGTGNVQCEDFIKCLRNSASALKIINSENKLSDSSETTFSNNFFEKNRGD